MCLKWNDPLVLDQNWKIRLTDDSQYTDTLSHRVERSVSQKIETIDNLYQSHEVLQIILSNFTDCPVTW